MWRCEHCDAEGEEHFEVCWRCGAPRAGVPEREAGGDGPPPDPSAPSLPSEEEAASEVGPCPACGAELDYRGEMRLRHGGPEGWSLFREWKELGERLWPVHVWACTACRRLELYEGE